MTSQQQAFARALPATARSTPALSGSATSATTSAGLVNLAGRQRMLSQRLALKLTLAAQGCADALPAAREAWSLFERSHRELLGEARRQGGAMAAAFDGPGAARAPIEAFIAAAQRVLQAMESAPRPDGAREVLALAAQADALLEVLNTLTQQIEAQARAQAQALQARQDSLLHDIGRISGEARLVSMNARVIAARAGRDGASFAVVAHAMAELSERVQALSRAALAADAR